MGIWDFWDEILGICGGGIWDFWDSTIGNLGDLGNSENLGVKLGLKFGIKSGLFIFLRGNFGNLW